MIKNTNKVIDLDTNHLCARNGCINRIHAHDDYCESCIRFVKNYNLGDLGGSAPFELASLQGMSWIYFIGSPEHDFIKIGRATDIRLRMPSMASGSPYDIELIASFFSFNQTEKLLHQMFSEYRKRGEWFIRNEHLDGVIDEILSGNIPEYLYHPCNENTKIR